MIDDENTSETTIYTYIYPTFNLLLNECVFLGWKKTDKYFSFCMIQR